MALTRWEMWVPEERVFEHRERGSTLCLGVLRGRGPQPRCWWELCSTVCRGELCSTSQRHTRGLSKAQNPRGVWNHVEQGLTRVLVGAELNQVGAVLNQGGGTGSSAQPRAVGSRGLYHTVESGEEQGSLNPGEGARAPPQPSSSRCLQQVSAAAAGDQAIN